MLTVLFRIGSFKFYSFGSFIALGTILGGYLVFRLSKSRKLKTNHLFDTVLYTLLFALLGARITYYLIYSNQFQGFWQLVYFWQGGLVALGGLIVGFLTYFFLIRKEKDPIWQMLDVGALGLILAWAIGKFGCFLATCSIGRDANNFLSVNGMYPVDLFAAIWAAAVFAVMLWIWLKNRLSDGVVFFLVLEGLFLGSLLLNTLRADYGDTPIRVEAILDLVLIVTIYITFWRLHGPKFEKNRFGLLIRNFVFRRHE